MATKPDLEEFMKDADESKESIELDKLDVSSMTMPSPRITRFEKNRVLPLRSILALVSKEKMFICAFLLGLLVASTLLYFLLTNSSSNKPDSGATYVGSVVYIVSSPIAERHYVRFKLSIPFKDNKEKADLMQKLPTIKEKLSMSGSGSSVAQSIEKKNLKTLKKHLLKIVNELTRVPIEALHLEELTLDPTAGKALYNTS